MISIFQNVILAVSLFLSLFFGINADNLTATVDHPVTTETQTFTVTVKNETRGCTQHSGSVLVTAIEQKIDGEWTKIGYVKAIPEDAMAIYPTFKVSETFSIKRMDIDSLTIGEYRFVIPYRCDGVRTAYAYFTVTE